MIGKLAFVISLMVLVSPMALADSVDLSFLDDVVGTEIPSPADGIFGNERINAFIGEYEFGVATVDGVVDSVQQGLLENPTLLVHVDGDTLNEIIESEDPKTAFSDAFKDGKIKYEGVGFFKSIKFGILGFLAKLFL